MQNKRLWLLAVAVLTAIGPVSVYGASEKTDVPPDTPERFLERYDRFAFKEERKAIERINKQLGELTKKKSPAEQSAPLITERDRLIAEFWTRRDPNPATPENEFKQLVDERINDIAEERFFSNSSSPGLLFRTNAGFHGDMTTVYLLHGAPDSLSLMERQMAVSDLMLWAYVDDSGQQIKYAFLFYRRGGSGPFRLFPQDIYRMDPCQAVNEIMNFRSRTMTGCDQDIMTAAQSVQMATASGGTPGYLFLWALTNFSQDSSLTQGRALQAPLPASTVAKASPSRVAGEAPAPVGKALVQSSCDKCKSNIPAQVDWQDYTIKVLRKNLDWEDKDGALTCPLVLIVHFSGLDQGGPARRGTVITVKTTKELLASEDPGMIAIRLSALPEIKHLKRGSRISIYLKNGLTNKYAALVKILDE